MSEEQFWNWVESTDSDISGANYCEEVDSYTDDIIKFDSCVYAGEGMESWSSKYMYKTNFNNTEEENNFSCIAIEEMEPFQICNGKTRIYLDKNLVYSQINI